MFSRPDQLLKKTGPDGIGRYDFLKQLINEFTTTKSYEAKKETLANLANFAYDPINFEYIKQLHITDLFLAQLSENSEELLDFALAGLCNLSSDPELQDYIRSVNGIYLISKQIPNKNDEITLNALATLYLILKDITEVTQDTINNISQLQYSENIRLRNLEAVFTKKFISDQS